MYEFTLLGIWFIHLANVNWKLAQLILNNKYNCIRRVRMSRNLALFAPLACMVMYLVWSPLVFAVVPPADAGYVLYNERIGGEVRGARAFPGGG